MNNQTETLQTAVADLKRGQVLIVFGADEDASFEFARTVAQSIGTFVSMELMKVDGSPFGLGRALHGEPNVLILGGFCGTAMEACFVKGIVASETVMLDFLGRPSTTVRAPKLILVGSRFNEDGLKLHDALFSKFHCSGGDLKSTVA